MKPTPFLLVTAVVEVAAGLFLLVLPGVLLRLLLGMAQLPADVLLVARWVESPSSRSAWPAVWRVTTAAARPCVASSARFWCTTSAPSRSRSRGVGLHLTGLLLWPAVALHAVLAVWGALSLNAATAPGDRG